MRKCNEPEFGCMEDIIKFYICKMESVSEKEDENYGSGIKAMKKIDLAEITEETVKNFIEPFLFKWGMMTRLGYSEKGWGERIKNVMKDYSEDLQKFRNKNLISADIRKCKSTIKSCYEALRDNMFNKKKTKQKVAASKILHLICPDFFPPWDNAMIDAYWIEVEDKKKKAIEHFSGEDYYNFMQVLKKFIEKHQKVFLKLSKEHKKPLLKVMDEFLWFAANRPLFLFLKEKDG